MLTPDPTSSAAWQTARSGGTDRPVSCKVEAAVKCVAAGGGVTAYRVVLTDGAVQKWEASR